MSRVKERGRFASGVSFLLNIEGNPHPSPWGEGVFPGRANRHAVTIEAKPERVYQALVDFSEVKRWCPQEKILVEKITPGKFCLGTKIRYRLNYRVNPTWHSVVVGMEENRRIINRFTDGIFEGSFEIWQLRETGQGTELSHTLIYRINKLILRIGWIFLGGEAKHNELTEEALNNLKRILEEKSASSVGTI
jgi:uncharacterized protein YndB with AHSA1/START domain